MNDQPVLELQVADMTCGHCVRSVTAAVHNIRPTADVRADLAAKRVSITDAGDPAVVIAALVKAGFTPTTA